MNRTQYDRQLEQRRQNLRAAVALMKTAHAHLMAAQRNTYNMGQGTTDCLDAADDLGLLLSSDGGECGVEKLLQIFGHEESTRTYKVEASVNKGRTGARFGVLKNNGRELCFGDRGMAQRRAELYELGMNRSPRARAVYVARVV